jgi:hypothetical protein
LSALSVIDATQPDFNTRLDSVPFALASTIRELLSSTDLLKRDFNLHPQTGGIALTMLYQLVVQAWECFKSTTGAFIARCTIVWKLWHLWRGTYTSKVQDLHAQQGAVVQVGPREYSISDPADFERCVELATVNKFALWWQAVILADVV